MTDCANPRGFKVVGQYVDEGISGSKNHDQNSIDSWLMLIGGNSMLCSAGR